MSEENAKPSTSSVNSHDTENEKYSDDERETPEFPDDDNKWTLFLKKELEEIEQGKEPTDYHEEQIELTEEKQKNEQEERWSKRFPLLRYAVVPPEPDSSKPKPTAKEIEASKKAAIEKREKMKREIEAYWEERVKNGEENYEKLKKLRKEKRTRDHYWKPHPLFYLYLRQLGYPKIAIDRALYVVDNKSAREAIKYIKTHPDIKELTKEEVIADAEEYLQKVRPKLDPVSKRWVETEEEEEDMIVESQTYEENIEEEKTKAVTEAGDDHFSPQTSKEDIEGPSVFSQETQPPAEKKLKFSSKMSKRFTEEIKSEEDEEDHSVYSQENQLPFEEENNICPQLNINEETTSKEDREGNESRGVKRSHAEEVAETSKKLLPNEYFIENRDYCLIFFTNTGLAMDSVVMPIELSKACSKVMVRMLGGDEILKKKKDIWMKNGCPMKMYSATDKNYICSLQITFENDGYISGLSERSNFRHYTTPVPTVLAVFGDLESLNKYLIKFKLM